MTLAELTRRSPLVPVAAAATVGILVDRVATLSVAGLGGAAAVGLLLFAFGFRALRLPGLLVAVAGLAALGHHAHLQVVPADDISLALTEEPRLARLRGRLTDEPTVDPPARADPLRSLPQAVRTRGLLEAEALIEESTERPVSGLVFLTFAEARPALHAGDRVEVTGWLNCPRPPDNPGERDRRAEMLDHSIRAVMVVRRTADAAGLGEPDRWSIPTLIGSVRVWARRQLEATLPPHEAAVAAALLLGDGSAMDRADWELFVRTGVVHVLAVSGQHLTILAAFAFFVLRGSRISNRRGALIVAVLLVGYGVLTGGRPPVVRAVVMVLALGGAFWFRRVANPGNTFALALLAVLAMNPANVADAGTQFSFLSVAVIIWGARVWYRRRETDSLKRLADAARPAPVRWLWSFGRAVAVTYAVTLTVGLAVLPLTAYRYHLVAPVGLLIGPPAVVLASVALVSGFGQLLVAVVSPSFSYLASWPTRWSLGWLTSMVEWADRLPGAHFYVGSVPFAWLVGFYILVAAALWWPRFNARPMWSATAVLAWTGVGVAVSFHRDLPDGLRVTFLAVGHGGATVLETADGRVMLVDVGSMAGPEVTRRVVAPYLWHRGVTRVDEVFLTHADLDHFNGLPALLERFTVGRVFITPSFDSKRTPGVDEVRRDLQDRRILVRQISAGDQLNAGDVSLDVLHPPLDGPPGPENARSLVLAVRHAGHTIMLTGDLDLEGRPRVLGLPSPGADVWLAPHHGGRPANPPELAAWARPGLAVAHNGYGEGLDARRIYEAAGARFLGTWPCGAVTVMSRASELMVTTFHPVKPKRWSSAAEVVRAR